MATSDTNRSTHTTTNGKQKDLWVTPHINVPSKKCSRSSSARSDQKTDSVISSDSDIRFTRRKLGDTQKCGCAVIAGVLIFTLFAFVFTYIGYVYFKFDSLPERIFRAKILITDGDQWTVELTDQSSLRFQHRAKHYQTGIDTIMKESDLKAGFKRSEVLALDGEDGKTSMVMHFNIHFDPYIGLVSSADLLSIFLEQFSERSVREFANITMDLSSLDINEITGFMMEEPSTKASQLRPEEMPDVPIKEQKPPRRCEPVKLEYCQSIGYNVTTYPNIVGHKNIDEVKADLITFREMVDSECYRQAYDFVCRLLQPPCQYREPFEPEMKAICREYCLDFHKACGNRVTERFKTLLDCEHFPESTAPMSCHSKPNCIEELKTKALSGRLCDGMPDCSDLSDEFQCSYCPLNNLYCGRGKNCVAKIERCDGKLDCPDGSDERDCLSIAPNLSELNDPKPMTPQQKRYHSEGFAIFSEKGESGKLCTEGMDTVYDINIQNTVAESLCKALGYEKMISTEIRNDTEPNTRYVRVLDPKSAAISFVRTSCVKKQALWVSCSNLDCGVQPMLGSGSGSGSSMSLSKMANVGDWPWHVSLFKDETHVCDGTLVSENWVLTTESCFQGQSKAAWIAVLGNIRLNSRTPWTQRRRIIGMVKSPVEGSTSALVRLDTSITYSDYVRPICLPDALAIDKTQAAAQTSNGSTTSSINAASRTKKVERNDATENRDYFFGPDDFQIEADETNDEFGARKVRAIPTEFLSTPVNTTENDESHIKLTTETSPSAQWATCNTLGWQRQREHVQRVQLKFSDMAKCENISIATVNSMCTEAAFHKQDCNEEEFAGSPVMCILPNSNKWALVGVAPWRIACASNGVERPRMYDKIAPNSAWIRNTINST